MGGHTLFLSFLAVFVASSYAIKAVPTTNTSYIVATSDVLVPGYELVIDLHLVHLTSDEKESHEECVLDLKVSDDELIWHRSNWKIDVEKSPKSFMKSISMLIPDIDSLSERHVIKIESNSCFKFSRSIELPVQRKELLVSISTDKLRYTPGELVLIQTLVHTFAQVPHTSPVNLSLYDSHDVLLVRWLDVTSESGMIVKAFRIPLLFRHENITIVFENEEQQVNQTVEVGHPTGPYDEELFLVDVRVPRYHTLISSSESKSPSIDINVVASKRFGVPLSGNVLLRLSSKNAKKSGSLAPSPLESGHKIISLKPDEVKELLGLSKDDSLVGRELDLEVEVEEICFFKKMEELSRKMEDEKKGRKEDEVEKQRQEMEEDRMRVHGGPELRSRVYVTRKFKVSFVDQSHALYFTEFTPLFFKPGLTYVGQVLLKEVEESVPAPTGEKEVTVNVKHFTSSGSPREEKLTLKLKPNSVGEFSLVVPKEDIKLELEALFDDKKSGKLVKAELKELLPVSSCNKDGHFIKVLLNHKPPTVEVGEVLKATLESTFTLEEFSYKVYSQSLLVHSDVERLPEPKTKHEFSVEIPLNVSHLLSSAHLVVLATSPSHEVLTTSLQFVVDHEHNQRPIELVLPRVAEPGSKVELVIKAEPFTNVYLATLPELLVFEQKEMEQRKIVASEKLLRHIRTLSTSSLVRFAHYSCEACSTIPSLAPDSQRVLNESGSLVLTDGVMSLDSRRPWPIPPRKNGTLDDLEPSSLDSIDLFEHKLCRLDLIGVSGEIKLEMKLPEESRLYSVVAFGFGPGRGFAASKVSHLVSSPKVLSTLQHPESVVRGEEFVLEVHLYNSENKKTEVELSMSEKPGYKIACLEGEREKEEIKIVRKISLLPKDLQVVPILIKSTPTGQQQLQLEVELLSEGVRRHLNSSVKIEYQGYGVIPSESELLDNFNGRQVVEVDVTKDIKNPIENSERAHVRVYGHPLGPAIKHVCKDVKKPQILEERSKLWFVLAVNILEHISNNSVFDNSLGVEAGLGELPVNGYFGIPVDRDECVETVRDSLDYLLNRRRSDGSYSFYPSSPGYVWLTTLMLDSLVQLRNVVAWERDEVLRTMRWLIQQQKPDGSFVEEEGALLIREDVEGSDRVPLTSQIVISLLEAVNNLDMFTEVEKNHVYSVAEKSIKYLESVILKGSFDSYSLSIASYALTLGRSEKTLEVLLRRDRLVISQGDEKHWRVNEEEEDDDEENGWSIEATSYAILTSLAMNDLSDARPYVNYVSRRMKLNGVFVATQDTNIALRALSKYHRLNDLYNDHEEVNVDVTITLADKKHVSLKIISPFFVGCIYFDHSNFSLAHPMRYETSGKGVVLVQSIPQFNQAESTNSPVKIDLKVEAKQKSSELLELKVCAVNLEREPTRYLIAEVPVLTGYKLNLEKVEQKRNLQVLTQPGKVDVVFNGVPSCLPVCVDLQLEKITRIGKLEPRHVKLYSADEPLKPIFVPYNEEKVEDAKKLFPECKC